MEFVFREVLGVEYEHVLTPSLWTRISIDELGGEVSVPDLFLRHLGQEADPVSSMPKVSDIRTGELPGRPHIDSPQVPVIFSEMGGTAPLRSLPIDIFGSIFFMLSRYEEVAAPVQDKHGRYPATASLAYKNGFLCRPIVDEYVEILWAAMKQLWPRLERKHRTGQVHVSCDVDEPFDHSVRSAWALARTLAGDLLKRRDLAGGAARVGRFFRNRRGDYSADPYYTFDWYLKTCEQHGRKATFHFIADHTVAGMDGHYDIFQPEIGDLISKLSSAGHEIAAHGSYGTFRDGEQIKRERARLQEACGKAGVKAGIEGNRQHYLRWDTRETPDHLAAAGYEYDATGSFADAPGFRYGTARPFQMWSWRENKPSPIWQRPLILMECSVLDPPYLGMGHTPEAMALMDELKRRALQYGGDFSVLWHNSHLKTPEDRAFFEHLIQ